MRKRTIISLSLLIIIFGGIYAYREFTRKNPDMKDVESSYIINATMLISEFENNADAANSKYIGKILTVKGFIKEVYQQGIDVTIALGDSLLPSSVRCSLDSIHVYDNKKFQVGDAVSIKGVCAGYNADPLLGSDVLLNRCLMEGINE